MSDLNEIIYKIRNSHLSDEDKDKLIKQAIKEGPSIDIDSLMSEASQKAPKSIAYNGSLEVAYKKKTLTLIAVLGSLIVILMAIIAFLLYWNSPEKVAERSAQQLVKTIDIITEETEKNEASILISEIRTMKAATMMATMDQRTKSMGKDQETLAIDDVLPYLEDAPVGYHEAGVYKIIFENNSWYLARSMIGVPVNIRRRIAEAAQEHSLFQDTENNTLYTESSMELFVKCE